MQPLYFIKFIDLFGVLFRAKGVVQISKEENVIIAVMDFSISHIANNADATLKAPHRRFVIKKTNDVSVKRMLMANSVIDVLMAHTICKVRIQKDAQNVSALVKQPDATGHICVRSM